MDLSLRVAGALLGGFLFSQSAEFTQQYLQRLGGANDALRAVVQRFETSASGEGLSREQAVRRLQAGTDPFVAQQGADAADTIARYEAVSRRYWALAGTAPLFRPFVLLADPDTAVLGRVAEDYRPSLPATPDGFALTLAGFGGGWALGAGTASGIQLRRRRRARRERQEGTTR